MKLRLLLLGFVIILFGFRLNIYCGLPFGSLLIIYGFIAKKEASD